MFKYQIKVEYLGTNFVGWQIQKNGLSVQEVLEKALSKFLKDEIKIIRMIKLIIEFFVFCKNCK